MTVMHHPVYGAMPGAYTYQSTPQLVTPSPWDFSTDADSFDYSDTVSYMGTTTSGP